MKDNIDLTAGRDFGEARNSNHSLWFSRTSPDKIVKGLIITLKNVPWAFHYVSSDEDLLTESGEYDPQFPTGSARRIRDNKMLEIAISPNHCDRCGAELTRVPWLSRNGLCHRCDKALREEFGNRSTDGIPWSREIFNPWVRMENIW